MEKKNESVQMAGEGATSLGGIEQIFEVLTAKNFMPADRIAGQQKIDPAQANQGRKVE